MKKIFFVFFLIFFLPTILAVNISMKTEYGSQETLIAKVSGEFLEPLLDKNIFFYRAHVRVPMDFDITKIQEDFYVYAILPQIDEQKDYSLRIKDIRYTQNGKSTDEEIKKDFSILEQTSDFNVEPGFVIASDDFSIQVKNLKDSEIEIKTQTEKSGIFSSLFSSNTEGTITLKSGETNQINFEIKDFESGLQKIELSSENSTYEIPVYLYVSQQEQKKDEQKSDEQSKEKEEKPTPQEIKDCFSKGGDFCSEDETCVGEYEYEDKGKCCLGTCEKNLKPPAWKIFGWGIIILIVLIIIVFFTKYKKKKKPFDLLNISRGKK